MSKFLFDAIQDPLFIVNAAGKVAFANAAAVPLLKGELASDDDGVAVRVSDEGLGMTPEQLGRVFERFYRADPSGNIPGTGLGLCLAKEIVERQGGQVTLDSEYGRGTTATIRFPRKQPAQLAA